jgi:hypothetical protein
MRLKDGFQACPRCGGGGCYWCRRQGWLAQCPICGNSEPELLVKNEDELSCLVCNSMFEKNGQLLEKPEPKRVPARRF